MASLSQYLTSELSATSLVLTCFALCIAYIITIALRRLYFSQYAKFPGPKLAALTHLYTFYYDAVLGGQYMYKIEALHREYDSPIIRISPHELHCNDPAFYDILFASYPHIRDKPPTWSHAFSVEDSIFGTTEAAKHRVRRIAMTGFFSAASIRRLEPLIVEKIEILNSVFRKFQASGEVVNLKAAFGALTSDIIAEYCFGVTENYIEAPGFNAIVMDAVNSLAESMHVTVQLQWLPKLLDRIPDRIVEWGLGSGMAKFNEMKRHCIERIRQTIRSKDDFRGVNHRTIFNDILSDPNLPESDKSIDRLWQEAQLLLSAGTVTTATAISSALVYLLLDQNRLCTLAEELEGAMPDVGKQLSATGLQKLPYLNAVVQETLRLVSGVSYRLVRSAPTETLQFKSFTFRPNMAISIHGPLIHHSAAYFPEPWEFIPERWLPTANLPPHIPVADTRNLVPFSRGTRNCIGMNLANAEIYLSLALVICAFVRIENDGLRKRVRGMRLVDTDRGDTDLKRDFGFPSVAKGRGFIGVVFE